ncbi:MAG: family N-acetyltransferase [Ferruginibacter sp.]|nr:family N-acetyltransferase [Ferruginibacter sp.]
MTLDWKFSSFDELTAVELYAILRLRNEVFVVEQNCVYQDADNKDESSYHISAWDGHTLAAYCRVLPPGLSYTEASIGRVVTAFNYRNTGSGRELMKKAVNFTRDHFGCKEITISAQLYLEKFYESIGFKKVSSTYLEDNIPHIKMQLGV